MCIRDRFYEITVRSGDDTIRRIIMIPTSGFPDDRESAAVNSVVKDLSLIHILEVMIIYIMRSSRMEA